MTQERPYFMTNPEWYKFDEEEFRYVLTDKAPRKAVKSYKEFYEPREGGMIMPKISDIRRGKL